MSLILALISREGGVVASDGRKAESTIVNSQGIAIAPTKIAIDAYDKTFSFFDGAIIGASAGLTEFDDKSIGQHLERILSAQGSRNDLIESVNRITVALRTQLQSSECGILMSCRAVDLLFVTIDNQKRPRRKIISYRIRPEGNILADETNILDETLGIEWASFGDGSAQTAAKTFLKTNNSSQRDAPFLKSLAKQAIDSGIKNSGMHPYGNFSACGGITYYRKHRTG